MSSRGDALALLIQRINETMYLEDPEGPHNPEEYEDLTNFETVSRTIQFVVDTASLLSIPIPRAAVGSWYGDVMIYWMGVKGSDTRKHVQLTVHKDITKSPYIYWSYKQDYSILKLATHELLAERIQWYTEEGDIT